MQILTLNVNGLREGGGAFELGTVLRETETHRTRSETEALALPSDLYVTESCISPDSE